MSESSQNCISDGLTKGDRSQSEDTTWSGSEHLDLQETLPLRDRMAMYQAAASSTVKTSTANVSEDSEACLVPGGLASMKKHFEKSEVASSQRAVTQYQYQQKSVQQTRKSQEVTFTSSSHAAEQRTQFSAVNAQQVSMNQQHTHETSTASHYNQEADEVEISKISTQVLKEQFERSLKEKGAKTNLSTISQAKHSKIYNEHPAFEWPVVSTIHSNSASRVQNAVTEESSKHVVSSDNLASATFGSLEEFPPPPPPDILETEELADFSQSPEPPSYAEQQTCAVSKELYSKQRNIYELKRLYKHIHPEVRKNLQKEFYNEVSDIVACKGEHNGVVKGDVQQVKYAFENPVGSPQKCLSPEREYLEWDEILKGEVQSMRWVFENQPLASIKDESPEPSHIKSIGEQEIIAGGDVKYTTWMFETKPIDALGVDISKTTENTEKVPDLSRGDVRTATWLFETQPLDCMNKIYKEDDLSNTLKTTEDIKGGDVKLGKHLFETTFQSEISSLRLSSELEECKGDVKTSIKKFETEPKYVLKDSFGKMLEIKTVQKEEVEKGDVKTARWMFETQPLDAINQDEVQVKVVRGISLEESLTGGVGKAKWLFETQALDTIKEVESTITEKEDIIGADVYQKCWIFETIPMDMLKDNANEKPMQEEEIIGGDVSNTKYLFETVPMDELKENDEVGKLKQVVTMDDEKGDARHQRWVFETKPLGEIREDYKDHIRTVQLDEMHKGDVISCKNAFERGDLTKSELTYKIAVEDVDKGTVKLNKKLFETTPLYAIQDRFGHYHEVQTIRKEEVVRGDVRNCQWMFETIPIDQFRENVESYQIIKGISSEQIQSGDVKTGKWLFETQPLDSFKYVSSAEDEEIITENETDIVKGDVKMCKWLFETQQMEDLYDKQDKMSASVDIQKGDVKTCTWLFETQPLDTIHDESEKTETIDQNNIQGRDVQRVCFLFETENLDNIQEEEKRDFKRVVEIDIQSGDVSSMKYIFENQPLDKISSNSDEVLQKIKTMKQEDLQNGNVLSCKWLFENRSIDEINTNHTKSKSEFAINDVQGGNVRKGCFIFETFSLDQIKDKHSEEYFTRTIDEEEIIKGDVKNYTLMFETQPLYAIQDKEGFYHEVTTVKKEEVSHGNVRGTRWLFETKPLDSFQDSNKVYIIKSVTQEDIQKGDVNSVRYRFETQSLDTISEDTKTVFRTIEDVQGGNVKGNKERFEQEDDSSKYVRTVSISEIKQGNVKTSTWLFETHSVDEIHGEDYQNIKTVSKEDIDAGDVKEAVWLFENHNLDLLKKGDENVKEMERESIPHADVRTTTWLFETTPLHEFNEHTIEKQDIIGKNIQETLKELYSHKIVESHGIILEADEIGDIRMAKYKLMNQDSPKIQKEEIISGDLHSIMMNLLSENSSENRMIMLNDEEKGNVSLTKCQLFNRTQDIQEQKEDIIRGDIQDTIKNLLNIQNFCKQGILIQESEKGDIKMTVYSLLNQSDKNTVQRDEVIAGDIKHTLSNLKSFGVSSENREKVKIEDSERGNVQFYTTCIESGALDYLRQLQKSTDESVEEKEHEEIIGGDVEGTKLQLKRQHFQIERTVDESDIIPGDVYNTVKVFMTEPEHKSFDVNKEEVVKGNLRETLNSLSQAINQNVTVQKEEIIKADLPAMLKSLNESQYQMREVEKADVIPGDVQRTINSLEKTVNMKPEFVKEEIVHGNLDATLKSLQEAQHYVKQVEKENVISGNIDVTMKNLLDVSSEKKYVQHQVSIQGDVRNTIKSFKQPSINVQCQEGKVKNTKQSTQQSETQCKTETDLSSGEYITAGHDDNPQSLATNCKNQQSLNTGQETKNESQKTLVNNVPLKNEENRILCRKVASKDSVCSVTESKLKMNKTAWKKQNTISGTQSSELISGEKKCLLQGFSEGHKEKTPTDTINQSKVIQKAQLSSSINTFKSTASQQAINVINESSHQVFDHAHRQVTNQQTQITQYATKSHAKNQVDIQQAEILDSINNNIENKEKVQMPKESKTLESRSLTKKKSIEDVTVKRKIGSSISDHHLQMKNNPQALVVRKSKEKPEIYSPPPPPPPPPPVIEPLAAQLPLPPPPPPFPLIKTNNEPEHFPSPPPPVTDKLYTDIFPPVAPVTPPPLTNHKDNVNKKVSFQPFYEQKTQHFSNNYSIKQSGTKQKSGKNKQAIKYFEKQMPDVPPKSKLPVFQHKVEDITVTNKSKSKQSTTSEYVQNISATQVSELQKKDSEQGIISQGALSSKEKVHVPQNIPPTLKPETGIVNSNVLHVKVSETNVQDIDQLMCDQELERIHNETFKTKETLYLPPIVSPGLKTESHLTKSTLQHGITSIINEQKISQTEATVSQHVQNIQNNDINVHDFDQAICDREMERIHEETLKPKKKTFYPPKSSPFLQPETPPSKLKTNVRKFKTPLMIAEEKYRQQKEEMEKNKEKTLCQGIKSEVAESHIVQAMAGSEVNISVKDSQNVTERTTCNLHHTNHSVPPVHATESKTSFLERQNLSKQSNQVNIKSDEAQSIVQRAQVKHEPSLQMQKKYETPEHTSEQYVSSNFEGSDNVEQFKQPSFQNISPSLQRMPPNKNVKNLIKPGKLIQEVTSTESKLQIDNKSHLTKQEIAKESHKVVHFRETSPQQSVSQTSKQKEQDASLTVNTQSVEMDTRKVESKSEVISLTRSQERVQSPKIFKKLQAKKEQSNTDSTSTQIRKLGTSEDISGHQQRQFKSPNQKSLVQESNMATQKIVKDKKVHEREMAENKKIFHSTQESVIKKENTSIDVIECIRKCEELQEIIIKINTFESNIQTLNTDTFTTFLNIIPGWLISEETKKVLTEMASSSNLDYIREQLSHIKNKTVDMQSYFERDIHSAIKSSTTMKSRNEASTHIGIAQNQIKPVSKKVENSNKVVKEKSKINNDVSRVLNDIRQTECRSCSPSLKTRSPSPTYITIESTARRTDSPHKERPQCVSPLQKAETQAPPPPPRSVTPKTSTRSEQLGKLKDTTAKLSQGTQARAVTPIPVVIEKKCEIIHSPATLRRQLKIESHATETICTTPVPTNYVTVGTIGEKTEVYEESRKSEVQKFNSHQEPKHIPEWLGQDVISITHSGAIPKSHVLSTREKTIYTKEKGNSSEKFKFKNESNNPEAANVHFTADQGKFQSEQRKTVQQVKQKSQTEFEDIKSQGKSRNVPIKQIKDFKDNASKQVYVNRKNRDDIFKPMVHSETISIAEHVSGVDVREIKTERSTITPNLETIKAGFEFKHAPPTYEDVISGHMLDISATESSDEILKNFQRTWEENERVFKSLGYTVSDTSEMKSSYHQEEYITENTSGQGHLHYLSKEGLSNGMSRSRQADLS
ncbi:xin actin-binding repeat-containing protein 2 isoform X2 [Xenopus laevis]|uniref:Xin actin-binding repeat-containing protein 2 isoform X2 n=1 Tax=Xenopus laevis TaxID=8355 RepID=A0A8J1LZ17_XENLA|nr:xin actin-binding repeat-containing protein 2 isoform X2 [Xenopus laevis]